MRNKRITTARQLQSLSIENKGKVYSLGSSLKAKVKVGKLNRPEYLGDIFI